LGRLNFKNEIHNLLGAKNTALAYLLGVEMICLALAFMWKNLLGSTNRHTMVTMVEISFLIHCRRNKISHLAELYLWLRMHYSGTFRPKELRCSQITKDLDVTFRTVKNRLKELIKMKWVTVNAKARIYRFKALQWILTKEKLIPGY
jgi:hypothetical protein